MNLLHLLIFPAVLFYIDWRLATISLAALPFDTLVVQITRRKYKILTEISAERSAALSARSYESLSNIRTVQALGIEATIRQKLRAILLDLARADLRKGLVVSVSRLFSTCVKAAASLAYGWYGWTQVLAGNLSLGTYMAFSGYVGYLYGPIGNLIGLVPQLETTLVHARRFFEVYDLQPTIRDDEARPGVGGVRGHIQFHDVSFAYGDERVLRRVSLEIHPCSTVAIVGKSGSGKSTLVKLIPRFYDPSDGYVAVDGRDIRETRCCVARAVTQLVAPWMSSSVPVVGTVPFPARPMCGTPERVDDGVSGDDKESS